MATLSKGLCQLGEWERLTLVVELRVQMLADSEVGDDLGRDFDCGAGAGVLAEARAAVLDGEGAKASDLDAISPS